MGLKIKLNSVMVENHPIDIRVASLPADSARLRTPFQTPRPPKNGSPVVGRPSEADRDPAGL